MGRFYSLRAGGALIAALSVAVLLTTGAAAEAGPPSQYAGSGACSAKLNGYQPTAESVYQTRVGGNVFSLEKLREAANGDISGTATYQQNLSSGFTFSTGSFTGKINNGAIDVRGSVQGTAQGAESFGFSFSGTMPCLLSQIDTPDVATNPSGDLPSTMQLTTVCELGPPFGIGVATDLLPVCVARQILDGIPQPGWENGAPIPAGGSIPYSWGAGHATSPNPPYGTGPSYGTCKGYHGPLPKGQTCKTWKEGPTHTFGLDCSGFTRWVFYLIMGEDALGPGNTGDQVAVLANGAGTQGNGAPGNLVYFYTYSKKLKMDVYDHVGIVIAPGKMIDEPKTTKPLRVDSITAGYGTAVYWKYTFPVVG